MAIPGTLDLPERVRESLEKGTVTYKCGREMQTCGPNM
jgi:hypothetical protein